MQPTFYIIDAQTLAGLFEYLSYRPYREVAGAVQSLERLQQLPAPSAALPPNAADASQAASPRHQSPEPVFADDQPAADAMLREMGMAVD